MLANKYKEVDRYLKTVYFTLGLAVMICVGSLNALIMTPKSDWFRGLDGMYVNGSVHSLIWLIVYVLFAVHVGEAAASGKARFVLPLVFLLVGSTLWCVVFFRLFSLPGSVAVMLFCLLCAFFLFLQTSRSRGVAALITVPVLAWYLYLFFINVFLLAINFR